MVQLLLSQRIVRVAGGLRTMRESCRIVKIAGRFRHTPAAARRQRISAE